MAAPDLLDTTIARWGALGAGYVTGAFPDTPDLERLILDTARCASRSARLVAASVNWLRRYADLVATHRLKRLIDDELDERTRPVLAFLLDASQQGAKQHAFATIIKRLAPAEEAGPLFDDQRTHDTLRSLAQRRASGVSRKWGLWAGPIEPKDDALRPAHWLMSMHPSMRRRADFRGDLRASVLAALEFDEGSGQSEVALAKCAGGSRSQVRNALANLEMTGRVVRSPADDRHRTIIRLAA